MLGISSLILSMIIACESEPDTTEVDQALEQFEPKGPTFQDRVDDVRRRIGIGLEHEAISELNGILDRRASEEMFWRMVHYAVWSAHDTAKVAAVLAESPNIQADAEHFKALQFELAQVSGDWAKILELAQQQDESTKVAWIARSILAGQSAERWIGELPVEEEKPKRRRNDPPEEPVLPDVTPEVALYRLIHLTEFPEGHLAHYQQLAEKLSGTEITLLRAEMAAKKGDTNQAKSLYEGLLTTDDLLLKQRVLTALLPCLKRDEQAKQAEEAFKLALEEGNAVLGHQAFLSLVDAWTETGKLGELPAYITGNFEDKKYTFKSVKPSWIHQTVAIGGLRGGAFLQALPFAQKLRTGEATAALNQMGAELETLIAVEAGQWGYIQENFFPSPYEEIEGEENTDDPAEKTDEQTAEQDGAAEEVPSEDNNRSAYELSALQKVFLNAYRGQGQSIEWSALEGYSPDIKLQIILSLSRRGLSNAQDLLEQLPEPNNILDQLSIDYRLLELAVDGGEHGQALAQIEGMMTKYGDRFPNLNIALKVQRLVLGERSGPFADTVTNGLWSALGGEETTVGTCDYAFCDALVGLNGLNTLGKEDVVRQTQLVWEQLPLHRKGIFSTNTAIDGSDGIDFSAQIKPLIGTKQDHLVGLTIGYQELERRRNHFRQNAIYGLNPILGLEDAKAEPLLSAYFRVRKEMIGYYAGGEFPKASFEALKTLEQDNFKSRDYDRFKPMGRVDIFGLQERLGRISLISYSEVGEDLVGTVISPDSGSVVNLGKVEDIRGLHEKHRQAQLEALNQESFNHEYGHLLRKKIYDPFTADLQGYGRYIVVAPNYLYQTSFMTLPEQQDGLLSLERNRTITFLPSLYEINKSASEFGPFESDIVGFARPLKKDASVVVDPLLSRTGQPAEVEVAKVHFRPDSRYIYTDDKVTVERYLKRAFTSRFLFLAGLEGTESGGLLFDDGELTLSEIQSKPLVLQTVFIGYDEDFEQQLRRVRAFMNAGARTVVVSAWQVPQPELHTYLRGIFEGLTRDDPLPAALKLGRNELLQQRLRESKEDKKIVPNPSIWGSFIVFGQP